MTALTQELKKKYQSYDQDGLNEAFWKECQDGHLNLVKYLLTSPELTDHADIHENNDLGFLWACERGQLEIVHYLLSFNEEQCVDFQRTEYNLDWALKNKHNDVLHAMICNLKNNDPIEYLACLPKIEAYNKELYEQIKNLELSDDEINSSVPELFM